MKREVLTFFILGSFIAHLSAQPIFNPSQDASEAIRISLETAKSENKRVLLEFGADWCPDCQNLAKMSESETLKAYLEEKFITIRIDVGRKDKNIDIAEAFGVSMSKGIPALVILHPDGTIMYASKNGEWANARRMNEEEMLEKLKESLI
jgi:thioredoxin 1